jgi:hypothetical protein
MFNLISCIESPMEKAQGRPAAGEAARSCSGGKGLWNLLALFHTAASSGAAG